jgi:hypothetical protein
MAYGKRCRGDAEVEMMAEDAVQQLPLSAREEP